VLDWLEQWARGRQVEDAALAVYDGDESNALTATPSPELEQFAGRHGLSFILGDLHTDDEEGTVFTQRFLRERAVAMTRTLQRILDRTAYDRYRAWGINE
jgi:hypothetical protein